MIESKYTGAYAAFKANFIGDSVLEQHYRYLANIIYEERMDIIDVSSIISKFEKKYNITLEDTYVRQVLSVGVKNKTILYEKGRYEADLFELRNYQLDEEEFNTKWASLISDYKSYCSLNGFSYDADKVEEQILSTIDGDDIRSINTTFLADKEHEPFYFTWNKYIFTTASDDQINFIASLNASFSYMDALFFVGTNGHGNGSRKKRCNFTGLNVYLDTPMIFSLLGMDSSERKLSYTLLLEKMQAAGCIVQVLDNNFNEANGILERAATWANNPRYNISKANNVAKYFHDNEMSDADITEYIALFSDKLHDLGIQVKETNYDEDNNTFQESEDILFDIVKNKYDDLQLTIPDDKIYSIGIDIRSIVMIYRLRQGTTSTRVETCRQILLTTNGILANAAKCYESNKSIDSGHIPSCISADLFGAILWLNNPEEIIEYQKKKLLADSFAALRPNKKILDKYMEQLEIAKRLGEIDENHYIFMRSHSVVNDALMNVLKGDYARFNERTHIEVYDEIKAQARKEAELERLKHNETLSRLESVEGEKKDLKDRVNKVSDKNDYLKEQLIAMQKEVAVTRLRYNKIGDFIGKAITLILFGFPYLYLSSSLICKQSVMKWEYSNKFIFKAGVFIILSFLYGLFYKLTQKLFILLVKKIFKIEPLEDF